MLFQSFKFLSFVVSPFLSKAIIFQIKNEIVTLVALCFYFCVCRFLLQNTFLKLDASGFLVYKFHPGREITENLFTFSKNILRKKTFVHPLGLQ